MFNASFNTFKGLPAAAEWLKQYQRALDAARARSTSADAALDTALDRWRNANTLLLADTKYHAAERYCIQQQFLLQVYDAYSAKHPGVPADRTVLNRAREVLDATPVNARPTDLSFLEGPGMIEKMLDHLRKVAAFYAAATAHPAADGLESINGALPDLPPVSDGFLCTVAVKPETDAALARHFWGQFKALNTLVRLVTLGNDAPARAAIEAADPIFFRPDGGQKPGRCLWVQKQEIHPDIHQWLKDQGFAAAETARCVFIKASGKLSAVLTKTDIIDETALLDEFLKASL